MVKDTILYDRLNISPDATDEQIKKAFNKLSILHHPDKNPNNIEESTQRFHEINEAKETLLDKEKRQLYDQIGISILNGDVPMQNPFSNFENIFNQNFAFNMGGRGHMNGNSRRGVQVEDITETLNVTLEQIYNEEIFNFNYKYKSTCSECNGEGTKDKKPSTCNVCNGQGMRVQIIRMGNMIQQASSTCNQCNGSGVHIINDNKCMTCNSKSFVYKEKTIPIPLKAGLTTGNKLHLEGKGHNIKNIKSDLILIINELPHPVFKRYQNDLYINIELKLYQALFGFNKLITHLDNRKIHICSLNKTDYNNIKKINNEGMKIINSENKGALYIRFTFILPNLNSDIKLNVKTLLQMSEKQEVMKEIALQKDNTLNMVSLLDCNNDDNIKHNQILLNIDNNNNNDNNSEQQEHQQEFNNVGCAQQ